MSERQKSSDEFVVSKQDEAIIESLLGKVDEARQHNERIAIITHNELSSILSSEEIAVIDRVYNIDPTIHGFKGPKLGVEPIPKDLVRVEPRSYHFQGKEFLTHVQYVPSKPYEAYQSMAAAMEQQLGRPLLIESSYRSNAFQAITFLSILKLNKFDVPKTAQRVAVPGYSEHSTPSQLAFDLQNIDGLPSDETPQDFESTLEYEWLIDNANNYGFFMSYPKDNPYGLMFEPWHWRHKP